MTRFSIFTFGLLTLVLLSGCVSQHREVVHFPDQQKVVEDPEKARVYVMRKPWSWNIASHTAAVEIYDGGQEIGIIAGHRGFLCWEREPGLATISCTDGIGDLVVTVEKGKVYYILQHLEPVWHTYTVPGSGDMSSRLELVNEEVGRKELSKCKPPTNIEK